MIIAKWKIEGLIKADAQKVAEEIYSIGDTVSPKQILEKGRDETTELHKCFEWDDTIAAEKYRISQARHIVQMLVIDHTASDEITTKEAVQLRVMYKPEGSQGYKKTEIIIQNPDEYEKLLQQATRELQAFESKYRSLRELEPIFECIDELLKPA